MNMINNLFSMFDPSSSFISWIWMTAVIPLIILVRASKTIKEKKIRATYRIMSLIKKEVEQLIRTTKIKSTNSLIIMIFFRTIVWNIAAILPFNFTVTAHISITFIIRASLWGASVINAIRNSTKNTLIHLTPIGTPTALINFIVVIELTRQIIRPITLAVRLIANIVAGHLLLSLLSNFSLISSKYSLLRAIPIAILLVLETAVALIQAYVITILITLYYKETT